MPYPEDFCEISGNYVWRKIVKFDDFWITDPTLLSRVLRLLHPNTTKFEFQTTPSPPVNDPFQAEQHDC